MLSPALKKAKTPTIGFGVFAGKDLPKGTITCFECPRCEKFSSPDELSRLTPARRKHVLKYSYERKDGVLLFACDDVIYINHSCDANTLGTGYGFDVAVRDIKKGEQITFDYRMFFENKWPDDDGKLSCLCGEPVCGKEILAAGPRYRPPASLVRVWNQRISSSLRLVLKAEQPLWRELLESKNEYIAKLSARRGELVPE